MRAVLQRVLKASIEVENKIIANIGPGLIAFIGIHRNDTEKDMDYIRKKILGTRLFDDDSGVMNLSVQNTSGQVLLVSQFTLYGDCRKGMRPSYSEAMPPDKASVFFNSFIKKCEEHYEHIQCGMFRAYMKIDYINDGPITLILDSNKNL